MAFDAAAALGLAAGVFLAISAQVLFLTDFFMAVLGVWPEQSSWGSLLESLL